MVFCDARTIQMFLDLNMTLISVVSGFLLILLMCGSLFLCTRYILIIDSVHFFVILNESASSNTCACIRLRDIAKTASDGSTSSSYAATLATR
jgi:hypothetical protein